MPTRFTYEMSLQACQPRVAAMWHRERNGELTPADVGVSSKAKVWWRCPHGHEWEEIVATRTALPAWKDGDEAACRVCTGYHVIATFACGHTVEAKAQFADPARDCKPCRDTAWAERRAQGQAQYAANSRTAKQAYADAETEAAELLTTLGEPQAPAPLIFEWRNTALHELRAAIASERNFGKTGAIGQALKRQRELAASLVPDITTVEAARQLRQPLPLLGRAHWPAGWLLALGQPLPTAPAEPELLDSLERWVSSQVAQLAQTCAGALSARDVTGMLTETVVAWAYAQETTWRDRRWNAFRELTVPLVPGDRVRYGRLDVTAMRPDGPDVVVEIDATHNTEAVEKLAFARAAGALPVWVRWRGGRIEHPDGVRVIDVVDASRHLAG